MDLMKFQFVESLTKYISEYDLLEEYRIVRDKDIYNKTKLIELVESILIKKVLDNDLDHVMNLNKFYDDLKCKDDEPSKLRIMFMLIKLDEIINKTLSKISNDFVSGMYV